MNGPAGHKEKEEPSDDSMSEDEFIAKLLRESIGEEEDEDILQLLMMWLKRKMQRKNRKILRTKTLILTR